MPEERPEVSLAIVVAGQPEGEWGPRDPDSRRYRPDLDQRRVERAEVRGVIAFALQEDDPGRVDREGAKSEDDKRGVQPVGKRAMRVANRLPDRCGPVRGPL